MRRNSPKKFYQWSPDLAYLTGLIASDGCLVNNRRHLNLTSKDLELINHTQSILNMSVKFWLKTSMYGGEAYHLQFSNVALYDFFLGIGLTPAKSKTIGRLAIPDKYFTDFLRGYFDGDGSIWGYWDTRWKNSLMYYTSFASASLPFIQWLQEKNSKLLGVSSGHIKPGTRAMNLSYAKADSRILFEAMYSKPSAFFLDRKRSKFIDFLRTDPYASKAFLARVL